MKTILLTLLSLVVIPPASAEVVAREFVSPLTGTVSTAYVLQGSHRMKHLGKGRTLSATPLTSLSPAVVPTVLPALENAEIAPPAAVPRFGFGSNYRPDEDTAAPAPPVIAPFVPIYQKPVHHYHYHYPSYFRYQVFRAFRPCRTFSTRSHFGGGRFSFSSRSGGFCF